MVLPVVVLPAVTRAVKVEAPTALVTPTATAALVAPTVAVDPMVMVVPAKAVETEDN